MPGIINARIPDTNVSPGTIKSKGDIASCFKLNQILIITDAGLVKAGNLDEVQQPLKQASLSFDIFNGCKEPYPISLLEKSSQKVNSGIYNLLYDNNPGDRIYLSSRPTILQRKSSATRKLS